ncbi:Sphingolipid delta4-desaturase N-terminal [Trinorchestia longiramus]|nr:Sphingolipid delta4-desaturase N-terminal [Trinorchestia longiramus]
MGQKITREEFHRTYTEEPHATRRKLILQKHPEVKQLFGPDPWTGVSMIAMVIFQICSLFFVVHMRWWEFLLMAYFVGGTVNHSLVAGMHECVHYLIFGYKYPMGNMMVALIANLPLGAPLSAWFREYHMEHHKFQGVEGIDTDLPTEYEIKLFNTTGGKILYLALRFLTYGLRPIFVKPKPLTTFGLVSFIVQFSFNYAVFEIFGVKALVYLIVCSMLGMSLNPLAGRFISEHVVFTKGYETYSYYGPLNKLGFNLGYHNEHHDFPFIPGSRLPKLREIAPEFYDELPQCSSWVSIFYHFVMDPSIGPAARIARDQALLNKKREEKNSVRPNNLPAFG